MRQLDTIYKTTGFLDNTDTIPAESPEDTLIILHTPDTLIDKDTAVLTRIDSLSAKTDSLQKRETTEIRSITPLKREKPLLDNDWIMGIIFFGIILFSWMKVSFPKRLEQFVKGFIQQRFMFHLTREGNLFNERLSLGLFLVYLTELSLFLLLLNHHILHIPFESDTGIQAIWKIMLYLFLFVAAKMLLMRFVGFIFRTGTTTYIYILDMLLYNLMAGIALLPILLLASTSMPQFFLKAGAVVLGILYIWRILRGINIGLSEPKFSIFYFILYLCTLEIFPALVVYKLIIQGII